jgi:hypothetical protein
VGKCSGVSVSGVCIRSETHNGEKTQRKQSEAHAAQRAKEKGTGREGQREIEAEGEGGTLAARGTVESVKRMRLKRVRTVKTSLASRFPETQNNTQTDMDHRQTDRHTQT